MRFGWIGSALVVVGCGGVGTKEAADPKPDEIAQGLCTIVGPSAREYPDGTIRFFKGEPLEDRECWPADPASYTTLVLGPATAERARALRLDDPDHVLTLSFCADNGFELSLANTTSPVVAGAPDAWGAIAVWCREDRSLSASFGVTTLVRGELGPVCATYNAVPDFDPHFEDPLVATCRPAAPCGAP